MINLKEIREIKNVFTKTHLSRDGHMQYCLSISKMNCSVAYWTKQLCEVKYQPKGLQKIDTGRRQEKCLASLISWDARAVEPSRITAKARAHIFRVSSWKLWLTSSCRAELFHRDFQASKPPCVCFPLTTSDTIWQAKRVLSGNSLPADMTWVLGAAQCFRWFCQTPGHRCGVKCLLFGGWTESECLEMGQCFFAVCE